MTDFDLIFSQSQSTLHSAISDGQQYDHTRLITMGFIQLIVQPLTSGIITWKVQIIHFLSHLL